MNKFRIENDLIGDLEVPNNSYYGVQTQRAINNFKISGKTVSHYSEFVKALGYVKIGALRANYELGLIPKEIFIPIEKACLEVIDGKFDKEFPVDLIQGGAGTSVNMNANEVIANRALEIMGKEKGDYKTISPNDHINMSQSTNDAYPTAIRLAILLMNKKLIETLKPLISSFSTKSEEFKDVLKMGRTQLQDAVPMTLGQEFMAFADNLEEEILSLNTISDLMLQINMGATAIGTGINSLPGYAQLSTLKIKEVTGLNFSKAKNLIEATPDTGAYVLYSSALKRLAIKLSKICNDLRLLSSGPRAGLNEINLPAMQPGSSIMPGKVNPVIPEVVNQVCYKVIGNDVTVSFAAEAGQLQLNVMEPIIVQSILESIEFLMNAIKSLKDDCIVGITANKEICKKMIMNSIGIVTALNPYIGYKNSTKIAKEALDSGKGVYELVLEHKLMTKEQLDEVMKPENMVKPHKF